ncbi:MAG: peptide chain release factor N(5)-glutamine methyltransferase [Candidatus Omnitrophica bacterium]|nr:peptide chain release factor N(5)-glutamine methyltransferase [Candidatus Omnitrophota bacterium]
MALIADSRPAPCQELLKSAAAMLEEAGIDRPRWTAEQLLSRCLGCRPVELYVEPPPVEADHRLRFEADVAARIGGMPLQYIMRSASFYGRDFIVGPGVFIPRPETEVLMDTVLYLIHHAAAHSPYRPVRLIDVGTGSGAIAVTIALERPDVWVTGIDVSKTALTFAKRNADLHRVRVPFLQGDLVDPLSGQTVDLIAANLPYLDPAASGQWPAELAWEPWLALDGGSGSGTALVRRIVREAPSVLEREGKMVLEIAPEQVAAVSEDAAANGFLVERVVRDMAGRNRVIVLKRG